MKTNSCVRKGTNRWLQYL